MPDELETTMPRQKQQPVVGTPISKVKQLNIENTRKIDNFNFNMECQKEWKKMTESGEAKTTVQHSQKKGANMLCRSK